MRNPFKSRHREAEELLFRVLSETGVALHRSSGQIIISESGGIRDFNDLVSVFRPGSSAAIEVSPAVALTCTPFWSAVNFLSSSVANLPIHLYRRMDDGGKERLRDDRRAAVVGRYWDEDLTTYEGLRWSVQQACLYGSAFIYIERDSAGRLVNLLPMETKSVTVDRVGGVKRFRYAPDSGSGVAPSATDVGRGRIYTSRDIIEIPFHTGDDLVCSLSPVDQCRNAIALWLALERYSSNFYRDGGLPPLVMRRTDQMSDEAARRLRAQINEYLKRIKKEGDQFVDLPFGFEPLDPKMISPQAGQMVEAKRAATEEISRILNVPPILINDLSKGTYNNTEQQDSQFVKHTLSKWARQIESQLNLKLFGRSNRDLFFEFDLRAVERGLFRERIEGLARSIQTGMITPNEARAIENMPPMDEENADKLWIQGATVPIDSAAMQPEPAALPAPATDVV